MSRCTTGDFDIRVDVHTSSIPISNSCEIKYGIYTYVSAGQNIFYRVPLK